MKYKAKVIPGYGVASGKGGDRRYPLGTIRQQQRFFLERGLDLSPYFMGTLNVDIAPLKFEIRKPRYLFEQIHWSAYIPPENFYFFDVKLHYKENPYEGLIYMPDPATKAEHEQKATTLELILPKIEGLQYGQWVSIEVREEQLKLS